MYPLNSNGNYSDHHGHFATDSKQEDPDPSLSFSNFPSPYYNQCEFELDDVFLLHNQTFMPDSVSDTIISLHAGSTKNEDSKKATEVQQTPRKRTSFSKSDRHSKINTANGLRDRRMRLSLNVAREFFGLQDMLGFDKASRTVEWLLIQAREEIRKLERTRDSNTNNSSVAVAEKSLSSTSEGEVASGTNILGKLTMIEKKVRQNPLARDLREKARERAKARTKAKKLCGEIKEHNTSLLQAKELSPRDIEHMIDEPMGARDIEHMIDEPMGARDIEHMIDEPMGARDIEHMIDEPMATINKWNSNPMFNCLQNSGINQEHLSFGKPWEAYI